ncbi:transposable element Tcb1 transposase [Trichonephila clavipes]|nr:transposable element Tcb1 transposase [Trichonephila clavipes]
MVAVHFLYHENPLTWAGVEPAILGADGQRQTNHATQNFSADAHHARLWRHLKELFKAWRSRKKQRSAFDQVSEFDRGRIVAYRDCGLSFRQIGSRVGRNQTTVMRICDRWMKEGTTDRRGRSHLPQCTTSREGRQIVRMAVMDRSVTSRTVAQHIESVTHH